MFQGEDQIEGADSHTLQQNSFSFIIVLLLKDIKFLMQPSHFKHLKRQLKVRTTSFRMKDIFIVSFKSLRRLSVLQGLQ